MGWFGPSKDEVWRQLGHEIGAGHPLLGEQQPGRDGDVGRPGRQRRCRRRAADGADVAGRVARGRADGQGAVRKRSEAGRYRPGAGGRVRDRAAGVREQQVAATARRHGHDHVAAGFRGPGDRDRTKVGRVDRRRHRHRRCGRRGVVDGELEGGAGGLHRCTRRKRTGAAGPATCPGMRRTTRRPSPGRGRRAASPAP